MESNAKETNSWVPITLEIKKFTENLANTRGNGCNTSLCDLNLSLSMATPLQSGNFYLEETNSSGCASSSSPPVAAGTTATVTTAATTTITTTTATSIGVPAWGTDDLDFGGLSCLEILSMAQGACAIGVNQSQSQSQSQQGPNVSIDPEATTPGEKQKKVGAQNKKRKAGSDLNEKPTVRRQKYYWAKIDDPNKHKHTPRPKTPKAQTPKLRRKKDDSSSKGKENVSCKRSLNFEDNEIRHFEDEESKVVFSDGRQEGLRVYRRSTGFKLSNESRRVGPNFSKSGKNKKRTRRLKKSPTELKRFVGFNDSFILQDVVDLVTMVKGDRGNLLPTRRNIVQDSFSCDYKCVLSLLSTSMNFKKKKRSTKRMAKRFQCYVSRNCLEQSKLEGSGMNKTSSTGSITSSSNFGKKDKKKNVAKERKEKVVKQKMMNRSYQRKKKRKDYLSEFYDWRDVSLEQIMDPFIHEFETLTIYDDPRKLETWEIMVSPQDDANLMVEKIIMKEKALMFICMMRIFQGRKDFVEWKGSVLDSVVGVFLTQNVSDVLSSNAYMNLASKYPTKSPIKHDEGSLDSTNEERIYSSQGSSVSPIVEHPEEDDEEEKGREQYYSKAWEDMFATFPYLQIYNGKDEKSINWEAIKAQFVEKNPERSPNTQDSVDWEAVRKAPVGDIAKIIESRGQHRIIAAKIQKTLNRLVDDHGTMDLEWLRKAPSKVAKAYLLSFYGLGLKSVECLRLLTLKDHGGFPVDVNIKRIAVRLGWVPLKELPDGMSFHQIERYPLENNIQQYLLPRLSELNQEQRYELHYQMITFGKIFCSKKNPNCKACPFRGECKYYKSKVDSMKQNKPLLSWKKDGRLVVLRRNVNKKKKNIPNPFDMKRQFPQLFLPSSPHNDSSPGQPHTMSHNTNIPIISSGQSRTMLHNTTIPIIQQPDDDDDDVKVVDIEDIGQTIVKHSNYAWNKVVALEDILKKFVDDRGSIDPTQQRHFKISDVKNVVSDLSRALICADDSNLLPKHINPTRLRTEHQVYELPYDHPLLENMDRQEGNMPYLLAIFPQGVDNNMEGCSGCAEEAFSSETVSNEKTVPGILLIPVRTALRGFFPLNGTYFQLNEVFVDHETSLQPLDVPTRWLWELPKRTLYCGSAASAINKGLLATEIIDCNWKGFICTRAFNRQTRGPEKLPYIFHKSQHAKGKGKSGDSEEED